jgi:phosphoglycerol transferase MdoB-like AlkP superfamily enzyme
MEEIHFQCDLADYDVAVRAQRSAKRMPIIIAVGFLLFFVAEVIAVNLGVRHGTASLIVVMFCLTLSFAIAILRPRWIKKDFQGHPNFRLEQTLRIDDDGLDWKSEAGHSHTRWAAYTGYRETQNLLLFYLGKRLFQVIPKKALSAPDLEELRSLVQAKLPANAKLRELGRLARTS